MAKKIIVKSLHVASPGMFRVIIYDPVHESERIGAEYVVKTEEQKKALFDRVDEHNKLLIGVGTFFTAERVYDDQGRLVRDEHTPHKKTLRQISPSKPR